MVRANDGAAVSHDRILLWVFLEVSFHLTIGKLRSRENMIHPIDSSRSLNSVGTPGRVRSRYTTLALGEPIAISVSASYYASRDLASSCESDALFPVRGMYQETSVTNSTLKTQGIAPPFHVTIPPT